MDDLISRQAVKEWLGRWEGYLDTDMIARLQMKVADIPTHKTPSNTLGALDCVERQAAIDAPVKMVSEGLEWIPVYHIKELPSAEPERKKGKWDDIGGVIRYGCPFCHYAQERKSDFCPNCGADMKEGDSDD